MIGGVYCPLSPQDPQHRLYALVQQTQTRVVLIDHLTKTKFNDNIILVQIDVVSINSNTTNDIDIDRLSNIIVSTANIAYIIFTSGSTGIPKAVCYKYSFSTFI